MTLPPSAVASRQLQRPPHGGRWRVRGRDLDLGRPLVMGVLNVTPDSFSDGGRYLDPANAVRHAEAMVADGADILDVGGESTRPQGAVPVMAADERARVVPVVRELVRRLPHVVISVDTMKSEVAEAALAEGAHIVNDVSGFRSDPRMGQICAAATCGVVLMHSRGDVSSMATYEHAVYDDVVGEVRGELERALQVARAAGVADACVVLDPGIGFAKRSEHSLSVLAGLPRLLRLGRPLLVGASRKRFIAELTGEREPAARDIGSAGAHVAALMLGASVFRVHDVRVARQALDVAWAIRGAGAAPPGTGEREEP